jgi:Zn-dependent peptidase ImmA (M78 family)
MRKQPKRPIDDTIVTAIPKEELNPVALDSPDRIIAYCQDKGLISGVSTDVKKLIELTPGLTLEYQDLGEDDACIKKISADNYLIVVNIKHPEVRQKFSMAHEYIHFQFHRDEIEKMPPGEKILHRNTERSRIEYQANQYAAEILMPKNVFLATARSVGGDISKIASAFKVSTLAVRYRAKELGLDGHGF